MNTTRLGWELARARRQAGLSQSDLAERMGTTQSAVSRVESGRVDPSAGFLNRFGRAIGRPLTLTFGRDETPSAKEMRDRIRRVLGDFEFNPWRRNPTEAEARSLEADGLTREYFERKAAARARRG